MAARKKRGNPYSWQIQRLLAFADYETKESEFYDMCYEKTCQRIPYKILNVMIFFMREQYRKMPGSLVALYRVSHASEGGFIPFEERFEKYYEVLQEKGCL